MTLTTSHIRVLLAIAVIAAVAPLCFTPAVCETCAETTYFAGTHSAVGAPAKRPSFLGGVGVAMSSIIPAVPRLRPPHAVAGRFVVVAPPVTLLRI